MVDFDTSPDLRAKAMEIYPRIRDLEISHGRAAEILGVSKLDLIDYYCSIGIPYLDQPKEDLELEVLEYQRFAGEKK